MCLIQDESVLVTGYIHRLVKELILLSVCKPIIIIIIIIMSYRQKTDKKVQSKYFNYLM